MLTYTSIRLLIPIILLTLFILSFGKRLFNFKNKKSRTSKIIILVLSFVVFVAFNVGLSIWPFENLFITFPTIEDAFSYQLNGQITQVKEGKDTAMVFYEHGSDKKIDCIFYVKDKDGWKLGKTTFAKYLFESDSSMTMSGTSYAVGLRMPIEGNDCYVGVEKITSFDSPISTPDIKDSLGSEFTPYCEISSSAYYERLGYCAVIPKDTKNYVIIVDGNEYRFDW